MSKSMLFVLLVAVVASVWAEHDVQCPSKNGHYPVPGDCTSYVKCFNGRGEVRPCPEGFRFDSTKYCTPDNDADCGYPTPEQKELDSFCFEFFGYFPYPPDCRKYLFCEQGHGRLKSCPENQIYVDNVGCIEGDTCPTHYKTEALRCTEKNGLYAIPGDCTAFLLCYNGYGQVSQCPEGTRFDSVQYCTLDKNPDCGNTSPEQRELDSYCPDYFGIYPYPPDCHKYVSCDMGHGHVQTCPENQLYDEQKGCVESDICPTVYGADALQCAAKNGLYAVPGDCTAFLLCYNGQGQVNQCPEGFRFDSVQFCTLDENADCGNTSPEQKELDSYCPNYFGTHPYPPDCRKYVICDTGHGHLQTCPENQMYDTHSGCVETDTCPSLY